MKIPQKKALGHSVAVALLAGSATVLAASTANVFVAGCTPSQELGAVTVGSPPPSCLATFELVGANDRVLRYRIECFNITEVTVAHIHGPADAATNAAPIVTLFDSAGTPTGAVDGLLVRGVIERGTDLGDTEYDDLIDLMRTDLAYVNVHTVTHQPGEVRGQIAGVRVRRETVIDVF